MPNNYVINASNSISASNTHGLYDASNCFVWVQQTGFIYSENFNLAGVGLAITNPASRVIIDGSVSFMAGTSPTGWANYSASAVFLGAGVALTVGATGHINASGYWGGIPALIINGGVVTNAGSITGQTGMQAYGANHVVNTGVIAGNLQVGASYTNFGIYAPGTYHSPNGLRLDNSGTVSGDIGIWGFSLDIDNSGTIRGNTSAIIVQASNYDSFGLVTHITNHGTISADGVAIKQEMWVSFVEGAALSVFNDGVIRSLSGVAIGFSHYSFSTPTGEAMLDLINAGAIHGSVSSGMEADSLRNEAGGRIYGAIALGDGNDSFENLGLVVGAVALGAGNDTATGSAERDSISGGMGDDLVDLGAGADLFRAGTGAAAGDGDDSVDGGAGVDSLSALAVQGAVQINLATQSARGLLMGDDDVVGFENVQGSGFADAITGDSLGNLLQGMDGADRLSGGDGVDRLVGGLNADTLTGGAGADLFVFWVLTDSGPAGAQRDLIMDYTSGVDRIDLRALDADAALAENQAFTWLGTAAFTGTNGELRYDVVGTTGVILADVNGDQVADFALKVAKVPVLTAADFLL